MSPVTPQHTTTPDGEPLRFTVTAPPPAAATAATPILTAYGLVSSWHHWRFFTPHFAATRPVVTWDYRGHGGQPAPRAPAALDVARFADDAHAVWRASGQPPAIVTGLSFGVQVALEIWRRHPEMVRALVLLCGTAGHPLDRISTAPAFRRSLVRAMRWLGGQPRVADRLLAALRAPGGARLARELAFLTGGAHRATCPADVLDGLFAHVAALPPALLGHVVAAYLDHDAFDVLPTIAVPTLLVAGDRDQLTPVATAERMQRAIAGSELVVFAGHSHLVQVERPREVHATIERFLAHHRL